MATTLVTHLQAIVDAYQATGRVVTIYPRLHAISLNGGKRQPFREAFAQMSECLKREQSVGGVR